MKKLLRRNKGITLIALIITVIVLLLLAGATINVIKTGNIFGNTEKVVSQTQIEAKRQEIEETIVNKMIKADGDITIDDIMEELVKKGIIEEGNYNADIGQVKTELEGYVYQITEEKSGWKVEYVGTGEIEKSVFTISLNSSTDEATNKVVITVKGEVTAGITTYTDAGGTEKTYSGVTSIEEEYTVVANGTYTFTIENGNGKTVSKEITISNIVTEEITMVANPSTWTKEEVTVTVTWPEGSEKGTKEISTDGGSKYTEYTGETSTVTVSSNSTVYARLRNSTENVKTKTITINNIDKNSPTVTASSTSIEINEGDSNTISSYFTTSANGEAPISSTTYKEGTTEVSNTNTLEVGTHTITCTVTKETGATASKSITITVNAKAVETVTVTVGGTEVELTKDTFGDYLGKKVTNYGSPASTVTTKNANYSSESTFTVSTTYRLYYIDFDGKYGEEGTVYLKADCTSNNYTLGTTYSSTESNIHLKELNPSLYTNGVTGPTSTNDNMKAVSWLTDETQWEGLKEGVTDSIKSKINYIVGAPSLEMMMDSFNTHYKLTGDTPDYSSRTSSSARTKLFYKYTSGGYGYQVGPCADDSTEYGNHTSDCSVQTDSAIDSMYYTGSALGYWVASPSASDSDYVMYVFRSLWRLCVRQRL